MIFAFSLVIDIKSEISKFFETSPLRSLPPSDRYLPFQKRKRNSPRAKNGRNENEKVSDFREDIRLGWGGSLSMKLISENVLSYLRYYLVKPGNPPFLGVRSPLSPVSVNYIDPLLFLRKRRSYPRSTNKSRSKKKLIERLFTDLCAA